MAMKDSLTRDIKIVPLAEAEAHWPEILDAAGRAGERVVVERDGGDVAVVPADDLRRLVAWERERRARFAPLYETQALFAATPDAELERELERSIAQVRERTESRRSSGRCSE